MIYIRLMNTITHERSNYPQKMAGDSFFHLCTSERTHAAAPPFSQKVTFGSSVRTQTPSRRLTAASSCGARLWLRRINSLTNRRPLRQQILAVSRTAGTRMCCQLFAGSKVQLHRRNTENIFFIWLSQTEFGRVFSFGLKLFLLYKHESILISEYRLSLGAVHVQRTGLFIILSIY